MISHIKTMIPVRENNEVVIIYPDIYIFLYIYMVFNPNGYNTKGHG